MHTLIVSVSVTESRERVCAAEKDNLSAIISSFLLTDRVRSGQWTGLVGDAFGKLNTEKEESNYILTAAARILVLLQRVESFIRFESFAPRVCLFERCLPRAISSLLSSVAAAVRPLLRSAIDRLPSLATLPGQCITRVVCVPRTY